MNLILLTVSLLLLISIIIFWCKNKKKNLESFSDFQDCRNKGFTKEFCQINPYPDTCQCSNGSLGRIVPGFKGKCLCFNNNVNQMTQDVNLYTNRLLSGEFGNLPGMIENDPNLSKYVQKESLLSYFYPKRSWLRNVENIIPYKPLGEGSFY